MDGMVNAVVLLLIKELNSLVDTDNYKNYRPVSNLVFIGKLIERVVQTRLNQHLVSNNLVSDKNYAYEKNHSTELLLLKVGVTISPQLLFFWIFQLHLTPSIMLSYYIS